jgi:hypothetical protein
MLYERALRACNRSLGLAVLQQLLQLLFVAKNGALGVEIREATFVVYTAYPLRSPLINAGDKRREPSAKAVQGFWR